MPSAEDLQSFDRKRNSPDNSAALIQRFPAFPEEVKKRFPSMAKMEEEIEAWRLKTNIAIRGGPQAS